MKIIHCADLHLDSKIDNLPPQLSSIRKDEILCTFEKLFDYANANGVKVIIIAGDLFDSDKVSRKTLSRVVSTINSNSLIDVLYLSGNHEGKSFSIDKSIFSDNFKIFGEDFTTFRYGATVIGGMVFSDINRSSRYAQINFLKEDFNILTLHGNLVDYAGKGGNDQISLPKLKDKNIDYLALGHYHSFSNGEIDHRGEYAYSGTLDGRGFDETGKKGFVLIDTENINQKYSFVEFGSREFVDYSFSTTGYNDWISCRRAILDKAMTDLDKENVLKLTLMGDCNADFNADLKELTKRLNERFFFAKVEDKTNLLISKEDYLMDKSIRGEFIRLVYESDLTNEEKKKIINCGLNALKGEELL